MIQDKLPCGHRKIFASPIDARRKRPIMPCMICKEIQKKQEQAQIDAAVKRIGSVGKNKKGTEDVRVFRLIEVCEGIQRKAGKI